VLFRSRDLEAIERDVLNGRVSIEATQQVYGMRISVDSQKAVRVLVRDVTAAAWRRALAREERGLEP
jgi:N-methylhydantoinase B/oxoprolinase/acetone carboxylase alpha subunit